MKRIFSLFLSTLLTFVFSFSILTQKTAATDTRKIDAEINVAVVGDRGVGKTSLIKTICRTDNLARYGDNVDLAVLPTYNFIHGQYNYNIRFNFFDVSMELENFEASPPAQLIANCDQAIIVLDLNREETLSTERIRRWKDAIYNCNYKCRVIFIPNKSDLLTPTELDTRARPITDLAVKCDYEYSEKNEGQNYGSIPISAINGYGIESYLDHASEIRMAHGPSRIKGDDFSYKKFFLDIGKIIAAPFVMFGGAIKIIYAAITDNPSISNIPQTASLIQSPERKALTQ